MTNDVPELWNHQRQAIDFAVERGSAMWFMGMGTGKSRCAIEVVRVARCSATLVLCPKSVCAAWQDQFRAYGAEVEVIVLDAGSVSAKLATVQRGTIRAAALGRPYAVVVNYESARREPLAQWLLLNEWSLLVCDESHKLKNPVGKTSRYVTKLARRAERRLALTGTPMPHSPLDIFAQFRVVQPDLFGSSFLRFRSRYAVMGGYQGHEVQGFRRMEEFTGKMSTATFKAERDVLDLPEATHTKIPVRLGKEGRQVYDTLERDFVAQVRGGEVTAANALVKLLRLQQITGGMVGVDGGSLVNVDQSKQDALEDLLTGLAPDTPVVVFGRFTAELRSVHAVALKLRRKSLELSGSRSQLSAWQAGHAPILAVQLQSGGTGIDLTRACYCVYLSTGFSLGDYEQSLARVHRPGQDRHVHYYHVVATATVDEYVYDALRQRKQAVEAVLDRVQQLPTTEPT